jgi:DNA-binding MarR family transcriptional regulator
MSEEKLLALAQEIERDLRAIRGHLRRPLEAEIARGNLTGPQQSAVAALLHAGPMSLKELSGRLGLAHSTTSGIVDRLEKQGLVERKVDEADRRLTRIGASKVVRKFVKERMPQLEMHPLVEALRGSKPGKRKAVAAGVKGLRRLLEEANAR